MAYEVKKDPNADLDYGFDWTAWLGATDTITESTWTVPAGSGLTAHSPSISPDGKVTCVWLEGRRRIVCGVLGDEPHQDGGGSRRRAIAARDRGGTIVRRNFNKDRDPPPLEWRPVAAGLLPSDTKRSERLAQILTECHLPNLTFDCKLWTWRSCWHLLAIENAQFSNLEIPTYPNSAQIVLTSPRAPILCYVLDFHDH